MERSVRERARMERVRVLLRTRNDEYPTPRSLSIPSTPSGPAPGRKILCPLCQGVRRSKPCDRCNGRGRFDVDSYTGIVSGEDSPKPEPMTASKRESELQRLGTSLKLSAGETDPNESYGWERTLERRNRGSSYQELADCLEHLRLQNESAWRFITWVHGAGVKVELSESARRVEEEIVALVASWMPRKIRIPKEYAVELAHTRERIVVELAKKGVSFEEIGEIVLTSPKYAKTIFGRHAKN